MLLVYLTHLYNSIASQNLRCALNVYWTRWKGAEVAVTHRYADYFRKPVLFCPACFVCGLELVFHAVVKECSTVILAKSDFISAATLWRCFVQYYQRSTIYAIPALGYYLPAKSKKRPGSNQTDAYTYFARAVNKHYGVVFVELDQYSCSLQWTIESSTTNRRNIFYAFSGNRAKF